MGTYPVNIISICAGIGGLDLATRLAVPHARTVCYVEREAWSIAHLAEAMEAGLLDAAPVWDDLATFDGEEWRGVVDLVIAGLPCQPWSVAGKRRGHDDERAIWPDFIRVVAECRPALVFLENVPTFVTSGWFLRPGDKLSRLGYEIAEPLFLRASDVGASHRRERVFILAYHPGMQWREVVGGEPDGVLPEMAHARRRGRNGLQPNGLAGGSEETVAGGEGADLGHATSYDELRSGQNRPGRAVQAGGPGSELGLFAPGPADSDAWEFALSRDPTLEPATEDPIGVVAAARRLYRLALTEGNRRSRGKASVEAFAAALRRVADGSPAGLDHRVDRLRALGNMVVPMQGAVALCVLLQEVSEDVREPRHKPRKTKQGN